MPDHHHPEDHMTKQASRKSVQYLKDLALRAGQTFEPPRDQAHCSAQIKQLLRAPRSTTTERSMDRQAVSRGLAESAGGATRVRDDETTGYGASARWA
jgi:hypothetical protein